MDFDRKQYFNELGDATVNGFTIIETDPTEGEYRIAERWERSDGPKWHTFWLTEDTLTDRIEDGKCEPVGKLSDEQFEKVCQRSDKRLLA